MLFLVPLFTTLEPTYSKLKQACIGADYLFNILEIKLEGFGILKILSKTILEVFAVDKAINIQKLSDMMTS